MSRSNSPLRSAQSDVKGTPEIHCSRKCLRCQNPQIPGRSRLGPTLVGVARGFLSWPPESKPGQTLGHSQIPTEMVSGELLIEVLFGGLEPHLTRFRWPLHPLGATNTVASDSVVRVSLELPWSAALRCLSSCSMSTMKRSLPPCRCLRSGPALLDGVLPGSTFWTGMFQ